MKDPACQSTCRLGDLTNPIFSSLERRKRREASSSNLHPEERIVTLGPFLIEDDDEKENETSKLTSWSLWLSWAVGGCATLHFVIFISKKTLTPTKLAPVNTVT